MGKKILMLLALANLLGLALFYATRSESKKRFIKHLVKQVPYMPARYFA